MNNGSNHFVDPHAPAGWSDQANQGMSASTQNLYIRGLDALTTDEMLYNMCVKHGTISSAKAIVDKPNLQGIRLCRGYGFVLFEDPAAATVALAALLEEGLDASFARVSMKAPTYPPPREDPTNLYFSNLPEGFTEQKLEELLLGFGQVVSSRILRNDKGASRGVGFARMASRAVCVVIIESLNGSILPDGEEPVICKFADNPTHFRGGNHGRFPGTPLGMQGGRGGGGRGQPMSFQPGMVPPPWAQQGMGGRGRGGGGGGYHPQMYPPAMPGGMNPMMMQPPMGLLQLPQRGSPQFVQQYQVPPPISPSGAPSDSALYQPYYPTDYPTSPGAMSVMSPGFVMGVPMPGTADAAPGAPPAVIGGGAGAAAGGGPQLGFMEGMVPAAHPQQLPPQPTASSGQ
jgi:RNA recognition motif-containing protein